MTSILLRDGPTGRRAHAITDARAEAMVAAGTARRDRHHRGVLTEIAAAPPAPPEPPKNEGEGERKTTIGAYMRRDLVAEPAPVRRGPGRPRKAPPAEG